MQQALVDAASKALSYRQDILEENIRLTYAVQVESLNKKNFKSQCIIISIFSRLNHEALRFS
jgi:hypothetical protein